MIHLQRSSLADADVETIWSRLWMPASLNWADFCRVPQPCCMPILISLVHCLQLAKLCSLMCLSDSHQLMVCMPITLSANRLESGAWHSRAIVLDALANAAAPRLLLCNSNRRPNELHHTLRDTYNLNSRWAQNTATDLQYTTVILATYLQICNFGFVQNDQIICSWLLCRLRLSSCCGSKGCSSPG